jgi:phosphohistidine phosphatase
MKTLLILRHAQSSWKDNNLPDHERPLNKRGRSDAPRVGELIRQENILPDMILCSTARRARDTIKAVIEKSGYAGEVNYIPDLYQADIADILTILGELEDTISSVLLVGHNPELEELVQTITEADVHIPTAALALINLPINSWEEMPAGVRGDLIRFWAPKGLDWQ